MPPHEASNEGIDRAENDCGLSLYRSLKRSVPGQPRGGESKLSPLQPTIPERGTQTALPAGERWLVKIIYPRGSASQRDLAELIEDRGGRGVDRTPRKLEAECARRAPFCASYRRPQIAQIKQKELGHFA